MVAAGTTGTSAAPIRRRSVSPLESPLESPSKTEEALTDRDARRFDSNDFAASKAECKYDERGNRYFRHCVNEALATLGDQVDRLVEEGAAAAYKEIKAARKERSAPPTDVFVPTSRKASVRDFLISVARLTLRPSASDH